MPTITMPVIARDAYDMIRIYAINYGIDDEVVFSSRLHNHAFTETAKIEYGVDDSPYFMAGCEEMAQLIQFSELLRTDL